MSLRETINEKPSYAVGALVVLVGLAVLYGLWATGMFSGPSIEVPEDFAEERPVFIVDQSGYRPGVSTDVYFPGEDGEPIAIAHLARVNDGEPFVHYFERIDPQTIAEISQMPLFPTDPEAKARRAELERQGRQVRRPSDDQWYRKDSPEGQEIVSSTPQKDGVPAEPYLPEQNLDPLAMPG